MGCAASRADIDERLQSGKERKRLIKQLVAIRHELADAQFTYLQSLKNIGVALRQFTDSESLEQESTPCLSEAPSSPSLQLPPSPPPPPPFSPNSTRSDDDERKSISQDDDERKSVSHEDDDHDSPSSPPIPSNKVLFKSSFIDVLLPGDEDQNHEESHQSLAPWKNKSVHCITRELDEYFLKAFDSGSSVAVLMDASTADNSYLSSELKGKKMSYKSILRTFSLSRSSRSISKELSQENPLHEPCNPGSNHLTLTKIHTLEQSLYKLMKEENVLKLEHDKILTSLQKQDSNFEDPKFEKLRSSMEEVGSVLSRLQTTIVSSSFSILEAIDVELYPQVVSIASGMKFMWTTMSECHQTQTQISDYIIHLNEDLLPNLTTEYHKHATRQLETETNIWLTAFEKLVKFQTEYAVLLSKWVELTDCLRDGRTEKGYSSTIQRFCDEWREACSQLPDKVVCDAMRGFGEGIGEIVRQHEVEVLVGTKVEKMEKRLENEERHLEEMERKYGKDPLEVKFARLELMRKEVGLEKVAYERIVEDIRVITLRKLSTSLPLLFGALKDFSMAYAHHLDGICLHDG